MTLYSTVIILKALKRLVSLNLFLIFVTALVFIRVPSFDFSLLEDPSHLDSGASFSRINKTTFSTPWKKSSSIFMPVTYSLWGWVAQLSQSKSLNSVPQTQTGLPKQFQFSPFLFHLIPLLLHLLTASLLFWLFCFLTSHPTASFIGALCFAIHPVQVESVAWVSGLKETLGGFLGVFSLCVFFLQEEMAPRSKSFKVFLGLSTISFFTALLSNPKTIAIPLMAGGIMFFIYKRPRFVHGAKTLILWLCGSIPLIMLQQTTVSFTHFRNGPLDLKQKILIYLDSLSFYFGKVLMPFHLGVDYGRTAEWVLTQTSVHTTAILFFIFLLGLTLFLRWNKIAWALACESIILTSLIPIYLFERLQFQPSSMVADHDLYLTMIGIGLTLAFSYKTFKAISWVPKIALYLLLLLGTRTFFQTGYWKNTQSLLDHALKINPSSILAHQTLGLFFEKEENYSEAISHYKIALELKPRATEFYRLGKIYLALNNSAEAKNYFEKALTLNPLFAEAYYGIGLSYLGLKNPLLAQENFAKALALSPGHLSSPTSSNQMQPLSTKAKRTFSKR